MNIQRIQSVKMKPTAYPVSLALCVLLAVGAVLSFSKVGADLAFVTGMADSRPWTALTYFMISAPIAALLNGWSIWSFGRQMESDIGSGKFAAFVVTSILLAALGIQMGSLFLGKQAFMSGAWPLAAAMILAWSVRFPRTIVSLMFVAQVEGKWLGILAVGFTLISATPYAIAPFALLALAFAWAFAANKIPFFPYGRPLAEIKKQRTFGRGIQGPREGYFDDVKRREKEREEKERLRKMFEGSIKDDDR